MSQDDILTLAQRLREYSHNPHHINPMSDAFHKLIADSADALSAIASDYATLEAECERLRNAPCECGAPVGYVSGDKYAAEHERLRECRAERNALSAELAALKAASGEEVEVVAYQCGDSGRLFSANFSLSNPEPLMRVSQHGRIVAAMAAELERVREKLEVAKTDELNAAVWAETESIRHDMWDAQRERDEARAAQPAKAEGVAGLDIQEIHGALAAAHSAIVYRGKSTSYECALRVVSKALHHVALVLPGSGEQR